MAIKFFPFEVLCASELLEIREIGPYFHGRLVEYDADEWLYSPENTDSGVKLQTTFPTYDSHGSLRIFNWSSHMLKPTEWQSEKGERKLHCIVVFDNICKQLIKKHRWIDEAGRAI